MYIYILLRMHSHILINVPRLGFFAIFAVLIKLYFPPPHWPEMKKYEHIKIYIFLQIAEINQA